MPVDEVVVDTAKRPPRPCVRDHRRLAPTLRPPGRQPISSRRWTAVRAVEPSPAGVHRRLPRGIHGQLAGHAPTDPVWLGQAAQALDGWHAHLTVLDHLVSHAVSGQICAHHDGGRLIKTPDVSGMSNGYGFPVAVA